MPAVEYTVYHAPTNTILHEQLMPIDMENVWALEWQFQILGFPVRLVARFDPPLVLPPPADEPE